MQYPQSETLWPAHPPFARWIRRSAAILLTLAAPLVSISGALTTGLNGTSPAVRFPPGYGVTLAATAAATTLAAVLAALIARRDALVAIPVSLGIWAITGLSVVEAGLQLGYAGLTKWGVILVAASLIGAAAGMLLAARRGPPRQPRHRAPATGPPVLAGPPGPQNPERAGVHAHTEKEVMPITQSSTWQPPAIAGTPSPHDR
jgi:hypothetical protein